MIALSLLAYGVGVWTGEALRDVAYGQLEIAQLSGALFNKSPLSSEPQGILKTEQPS